MVIRTIVHFEIAAEEPEKLAEFYTRAFGWEIEKAPMPGMDYWLISTGPRGKSLGGGMYRKMGPDDRPRNFVHVADIDEAIRTFRDAGGRELVGKMEVPGMGFSFIGADPEGNPIALWEPKMAPRPRRRKARRRSSVRRKK